MKKVLILLLLSVVLKGCATPMGQDSLLESKNDYVAKAHMFPRSLTKNFLTGASWGLYTPQLYDFYAYGNSAEEAKKKALIKCQAYQAKKNWQKKAICEHVSASPTNSSLRAAAAQQEQKIIKAEKAMSSNIKIANAKQACLDLGFKANTEKFADCSLKLVMLDVERTTSAKNEPQVVIHKNDVNVWDELGVLFRQQGIIQDTTRPANTRTNMRCTTTKVGFGQVVTNCR
jgi:hypothetical protein